MQHFLTTQKALQRLLTSVHDENYGQAYIFEGMKGVGKFTGAMLFSQAIHCTAQKKPCGICPDCKKHAANTHPDLMIIEGEAAIKVDDIRAMTDELYIRPAVSKKKICIVKNADNMNENAQNALLKSFEEPPRYGVIILLSQNAQNLLPTIRSRGMKISFEPFSEKDIFRYVTTVFNKNEAEARFISKYSGGVMGRAIDICENEEFFEARKKMFDAIYNLTGDRTSIFGVADLFGIKNPKNGFALCDLWFDLFMSFMRDVLAVKTQAEIVNADMRGLLESFSSKVTLSAVIDSIEKTANVKKQLNASMKYDLWIMDMLINCWEDIHGKSNRS